MVEQLHVDVIRAGQESKDKPTRAGWPQWSTHSAWAMGANPSSAAPYACIAGERNSRSGKWWRVAALAAHQHGVVSGKQLRQMGMTDSAIEHSMATGRLHSVFRGAFVVGHPRVGRNGRMLAAVLACGDGTVVSHGTAAALLGLWDRPLSTVNVIAPGQSGRKVAGIRRRHVPLLAPDEGVIRDAIPCTSPSRTLVDLAGSLEERSLRRLVETAAVLGLLDVPTVDSVLARRRRRGSVLLRVVLKDWRAHTAPPRLRSALEARLLSLIAAHDLPAPLCNQEVRAAGRRMEVDLLWPERRLVVEADGRAFHDNPVAFDRDRRRDRDLALGGYRVLRITWAQIDDEPEKTIATIRRLLTNP